MKTRFARGRKLGRSDRIRTYDPRLPKAVLYQAELHSDAKRGEL
jgi:hypothetical protein